MSEAGAHAGVPARPLVVRCGAFGDMVLITALLRVLHAQFGMPVDVLTSGPWSAPLLRGQPGVGEVMSVRSRRTPYWLAPDQRRAVRWLRERGAGPTWFCDANEAARPMLERAHLPARWRVEVREHPREPNEHATEQWRRLGLIWPAALADIPAAVRARARAAAQAVAPGCLIAVSTTQRAELAAWLAARGLDASPLICIQAGNKRTMRRGLKRLAVNHKYWPEERWSQVLRHVRSVYPGHAIVLLGTPSEQRLNRELMARARIERCHDLADDLPIPRLLALLERAAALISVDSGPAHAAAAVGCPEVVLFGKASPSLYRPLGTAGADVKVLTGQIEGAPSMLGISAEQVSAAFDELRLRTGPL
ncbi:MAG TPA: glycosyltransferase family 9 protein [Steroidobacteraceae bacterium]|nr:glycosyltransferase family 9 protein [Steroidobacteraceae bacterium]